MTGGPLPLDLSLPEKLMVPDGSGMVLIVHCQHNLAPFLLQNPYRMLRRNMAHTVECLSFSLVTDQ